MCLPSQCLSLAGAICPVCGGGSGHRGLVSSPRSRNELESEAGFKARSSGTRTCLSFSRSYKGQKVAADSVALRTPKAPDGPLTRQGSCLRFIYFWPHFLSNIWCGNNIWKIGFLGIEQIDQTCPLHLCLAQNLGLFPLGLKKKKNPQG